MPSREDPLTGRCACGAVRFRVTQPFRSAGCCHCHRFGGDPDGGELIASGSGLLRATPKIQPSWRAWVSSTPDWHPIPEDGLRRYSRSRPPRPLASRGSQTVPRTLGPIMWFRDRVRREGGLAALFGGLGAMSVIACGPHEVTRARPGSIPRSAIPELVLGWGGMDGMERVQ
jgi:hypothetical protein